MLKVMAAYMPLKKFVQQLLIPPIARRGLQTAAVLQKKHVQAGTYKTSRKRNIPLTYEEAKPSHMIGVEKAWLSWNTSNLKGEGRQSETTVEDVFIRNFMEGTWHQMLTSELIIKRRHNMIHLVAYIEQRRSRNALQKIYFLVGYTEELLSCLLKCPVKLELQCVQSKKDMIFKYI